MQTAQLSHSRTAQKPAISIRTTDPQALSGAGLRGFFAIADKWGISEKEGMTLLGQPSRATYYNWKRGAFSKMMVDTLDRLSYIVGIYKALRILIPDDTLAHAWIKNPNDAPMFAGLSPLSLMLSGKTADLFRVRNYLDAHRGGWG